MKEQKNELDNITEVEVIIPSKVRSIINKLGNKTKKNSAYKIYNCLLHKNKYKNSKGWFEISSSYLRKINGNYRSIIDSLVEGNILEPLVKIYEPGDEYGDLFKKVEKHSYYTRYGKCKNYRFNPRIDLTKGSKIKISFINPTVGKRWYKITEDSIERLGFKPKISRDGFGGRVYHNLTAFYKEELQDKGFSSIDAQASQPRLLYIIMKERGLRDDKYFEIFEKGYDFYTELGNILGMDMKTEDNRNEIKQLFMFWAMGNGYTKGYDLWKHFPVASSFLKILKSKNYKDSSRYLAFRESRIFVDDLLQNLPVKFGFTIHDSIIVRTKDSNIVLEYCQKKYPDLVFKKSEL